MASSAASQAARLCALTCRRPYRAPRPPPPPRAQLVPRRTFSACVARSARAKVGGGTDEDEADALRPLDLKGMNRAFAERATPEGLRQLDELAKENGFNTIDDFLTSTLRDTQAWASEDRALEEQLIKDDKGDKPVKSSFWYDEEDPETNTEEHDEFDEDDITSMAHGKLEEVREMRHYARLAVWEMPLLAKFAKPFEPPTEGQVLRWRYTTYMGEAHPAERKVVVQFAPDDLKLTPVQTSKLKKLAGPRYNPETEFVKMSCESYEHQAQNKAYLRNLVSDLIAAAKDPADTFEDVPLDLRHHRVKPKPRFPREWRMTEQRRLELEAQRKTAALADLQREEQGLLVDGQKVIDGFLMQRLVEDQEKQKAAELVSAARSRTTTHSSSSSSRR